MRLALLAFLILGALAAVPAYAANDMSTSTYAVIGDTPYSVFQIQHFADDIGEINADPDVSRVVHLGDIKSGSTRCDTADSDPNTGDFMQIKAGFDLFADPLVYTPGDNEWTDCHRTNNGGYVPTERLATLRQIFFSNPAGDYQAGYPENVTWTRSRVQFGVLNVPGSNNDWAPWFGQPRTQTQIDEVTDRTDADLDWLGHIFAEAKENKAKAVMIGLQADMWDPAFFGAGSDPVASSDHFTPLVQALASHALKWERPVVLMNGDSHIFEVDHPFADPSTPQNRIYGLSQSVPNIERVTVNGSTTACHQWLKLTINPKSDAIFSWRQEPFANQAPGQGCPG